MRYHTQASAGRHSERGISLVIVAVGMLVVLGLCALAIDLATLYVTRNEAQRAADAAALAGAKAFVDSGFTSGLITQAAVQALAVQQAQSVGNQNNVGGQNASIGAGFTSSCPPPAGSDGCFDFTRSENPRITVVVQRTAAGGNAMPTFFAKAFGVLTADVVAEATAEAYNSSANPTGPTICAACLKPFLLPNCDPDSNHLTPANTVCPTAAGYFIDPNSGAIEHPGAYPAGVIGEPWILHINPGPSQYQVVNVGCGQGNQTPCITGCSTVLWDCGNTTTTVQGARVGQMGLVDTLIHATAFGPNNGQDTIAINPDGTWAITGGANNPNPALVGKTTTNSDSLITVPLYDGSTLSPGIQTVTIIGYLQVFIESVGPQTKAGDIPFVVRVLNVAGCGNRTGTCGTTGSGGAVPGGGGPLIPIRLVRNPGT